MARRMDLRTGPIRGEAEDIDHDRPRRTGHEHRDHAGAARGDRIRHRGLRGRSRRPAGTHHVHRLHRSGHRSGGDAAGRARLARHADPGPRRVGSARRARQRGRKHLPAARAVPGSDGGRRPDVRGRRRRTPGPGRTRQRRSTGHPGLDRPRPRAAGDLAGLAPGRGRHRSPRPRGRGAFVDGLLGGLGFGVLFVALGQIPESAGTLPLALNQLTGALVTVVVATVLRQELAAQQPAPRAGAPPQACSGCRAPSPSSRPATSPTSAWSPCSPRSTPPSRCSWPAPCSASGSAPGSASGWCSAPRPSGLIAAG